MGFCMNKIGTLQTVERQTNTLLDMNILMEFVDSKKEPHPYPLKMQGGNQMIQSQWV